MNDVYIIVAFIVVFIFLVIRGKRKQRQKKVEALKQNWGKPKNDYLNFDAIERYARLKTQSIFHTISDQTKADINFYELFAFVDRTTSKIGQQYLFDKLSKPSNNLSALKESDQHADFFREHKTVREKAQLQLLQLDRPGTYHVASLLTTKVFTRPKWYPLTIFSSLLLVGLLLFSIQYPVLLIVALIPATANMLFHLWNKNNTLQFIQAFPELNKMIYTSAELQQMHLPITDDGIQESIKSMRSFQRKLRLLGFSNARIGDDMSMVLMYALEVIKGFFLIELHAFFSIVKDIEGKQLSIQHLFNYVGSIDTAISIASLRDGDRITCKPVFLHPEKKIQFAKLTHPLIADCVTNDLQLEGKSALITGSNMSGKTTFLRTICINALLAQTLYTCFAEKYEAPFFKLLSSVNIEDDLLEGKSYFFEEARVIESLIQSVQPDTVNLFVMDEVFKGTNTIERIAAAKAVLSYLNQYKNIVFVATHDLELADLLKDQYNLYHFVESIQDEQLHFDYKLKEGQLQTKNAIKILALLKFPEEIIKDAKEVSSQLSQ